MRPARLPRPAVLLLALASLGACREQAPAPPQPNVLLVSLDTVRADHLSVQGYARRTSPALEKLAARGVRCAQAFSTTSWTLPAHLSLLTGLWISAHGVADDRQFDRAAGDRQVNPVTLAGRFLPELLAESGYRTAGFYTWKYLEPRFGFGPGFEVYERLGHTFYSHPVVSKRIEELRASGDLEGLRALKREYPELFDVRRPSSPEVVDRALAWIDTVREETPERPFFAFLHLFDAHDPYTPPPPFDRRFDPDYDGPIDGLRVTGEDSPVHAGMPGRDLHHLVALYDGEIAWVDHNLERLLGALRERGLERDTLVIVTADHGEEFFEHGAKTHRQQLHVESVHVPLILCWPAGLPAGRTVELPVSLVDVLPTICSLVGLQPPPYASGLDLAPVLRGERPLPERTLWTELYLFGQGRRVPERRFGLVRGTERALLRYEEQEPARVELWDAAHDPLERGPGRVPPPRSAPWRAAQDELLRLIELARAQRRAAPRRAVGGAGLDALDLAELEAIGYTGEAGAGLGADGGDAVPAEARFWRP